MKSLLVPLLVCVALFQAQPAPAQESQWFGTWHLDTAKSTASPGPLAYKRGTWAIEASGADVKMVYDLVGVRGGVTHMEWTGRFDGKPYRLQGPDTIVDYAYARVNDRTLDLVVSVDGVPAVRGRVTLSPDGRSITATTNARNARGDAVTTSSVYEKQATVDSRQ